MTKKVPERETSTPMLDCDLGRLSLWLLLLQFLTVTMRVEELLGLSSDIELLGPSTLFL